MAVLWMGLWMAISGVELTDELAARYEDRTYRQTAGDSAEHEFHYRLLRPPTLEPGRKYPLVLFLHGAGERGDDNRNQLKYLPAQMALPEMQQQYPCFLLAPQCPLGKWWNSPGRRAEGEPTQGLSEVMQAVEGQLAEVLAAEPIDRERVLLTGLSMGGYGSWDLACRHPEWFAAVVPICGGGDPKQVARLVGVPVWAVHGDADNVVPVGQTQRMVEALRAAGGEPKYSELPGVGHNSWTPAYDDPAGVLPWMFEQRNTRLATATQ